MSRMQIVNVAATITLISVFSATVAAQCASYDFEEFAVGAPITTHLDGVSFSTVGDSCGGSPTIYMRVRDEFYGDTFSSKVLLIDTGCPDFSDDYLRMVFDDRQGDVRFTLGPWAATYEVRAYDGPTGGALIDLQTIVIPGTGFVNVHHPVQVTRAERDIRRIEIEASASGHEAIDNLSFGRDDTPPEVQIDYPPPFECVAGEITVTGIVCEDDGAYDRDRLEYMRAWPNPESDWTLVREFVGQSVCDPAPLFNWDTTEQGVIDGIYMLRVTSINACGLTTSEEVTVYVDNDFNTAEIQTPETGDIVGGTICFDGTAWEQTCFDHYAVQYKQSGGGSWLPVDPANPTYTATVTNDPLAWWADAQSLPDGNYYVVLVGYTTTGASAVHQIGLTLDNTPPTAEIVEPFACSKFIDEIEIKFIGTADDTHFSHYELQYWNPVTLAWTNIIAPSLTPVVNDTLASWDVSGLPACYYAVRLRVWDNSINDICGDIWRHRSDHYLAVAVGDPCPGDINGDGAVELGDLATLLSVFGTTCD